MRVSLGKEDLATSQSIGQIAVQRLPVNDERAKKPLQTLLGTYEAVFKLTRHHETALYVAAREALATTKVKPLVQVFPYPQNAQALAKRIDYSEAAIAGYCHFLVQHAETASQECGIEALTIGERTYTLAKRIDQVQLVGLEKEQETFTKHMEQLFLYNPATMTNPDTGRFPRTALLSGPPGTGKSSLIKHCLVEAARLQRVSGTPFRFESFDAANFSSYFGRSTRIMKQKMQRVKEPSGVGLFVMEDADMVLQSRDDQNVYHGVLQVQQYIMNEISGLEPYYGNTITVLTTNRPKDLDAALANRAVAIYTINPFEKLETHKAYFLQHAAHLKTTEQMHLATLSHAGELTGRDLEAVFSQSKACTTARPTEEELRTKKRNPHAYGVATAELLETLIAQRRQQL